MTEENKKIADFILSLFASDGSASQDDVHTAISERYDYGTGGFIAGWLAKVLADALGM